MSTPILATKLYIPPPRPKIVLRPRLIERLNEGLSHPSSLTLISAPAGFGKTTLVSHWLHPQKNEGGRREEERASVKDESGEPISDPAFLTHPSSFILHPSRVAWLSLDPEDNDPSRFLAYLVAALQTISPKLGEGILAALQSPQPPALEPTLTALLNEITTLPEGFVLVLDDYHVIEASPVNQLLTFLIEHLPPRLRLVITTREDPQLPLARLRVRGQLTELRAADLRFTEAEAAAFLNQVMALNLSPEDIAALENRTEGWIAGLQLAALSMRGRTDVASFIRAFAGDNRYIVDYLVQEVLQRQPERVRSFLLQTALLDRLNGSLCEAVTRQEEGSALLETLERGNLFVIPLDDKRHWYRYHHLFADVLQAHLLEEQPEQVPTLHRRASAWYEQNGSPAGAIRHALAAGDFERAAGLIELAWPAMEGRFQAGAWLAWARALPDGLVRARPVLSVAYAWALLNGGELEAGEARLRDAERWLAPTADMNEFSPAPSQSTSPTLRGEGSSSPPRPVVVDERQFQTLPASIATARAYQTLALGDIPGSVKYARRALDLLPEADHLRRGPAAALLGLAYWANGELEAAHQALAEAMANFQRVGQLVFAISGTYGLADIRITQGRLRAAARTYEQTLQLATAQGEPILRGTADLYLGLGELRREQGHLEAAREYLLRSETLGQPAALPDWPHRFYRAQARLKETQGDLAGALALLDEAERRYVRGPVPDLQPIAALKTRVWAKQGRLAEALAWIRERGLTSGDELSFLREFEHLTLARVLLTRYNRDREEHALHEAMALLERLLKAAEAGDRTGSVIEILVLQALAYQAQGDLSRALGSLEQALTLAEPEGYARIFVDEGPPMAALLREAAKQGVVPNYVRHLRAAFGEVEDRTPGAQPLIEPLSERELEVLKLLGTELDGPEMARQLLVSLNTLRTHTKNIYTKLGVNNRRAAIRRAEELGLL